MPEPANDKVVKPISVDEIISLRSRELETPVNDISELFSQSRLAFVIGAGASKCAGLPLMSELADDVMKKITPTESEQLIMKEIINGFAGGAGCSIEDYMSELVDQISLAERKVARSANRSGIVLGGKEYSVENLQRVLNVIKAGIETVLLDAETSIECHRDFVRAIHQRLQSGKASQHVPVDYFTLNYDTLLEDALALEKITTADGFVGGSTGWWNSETYNDRRVKARVFKIHGSIDWCVLEGDPMPRRLRRNLKGGIPKEPVVIWPAETKYRETQRDPYAQIIGKMRDTLRPPTNNDVVLAIIGYAFRDQHINLEIDRALREAEGRLTILAFTSDDKPIGLLFRLTTIA